MYGMYCKKNVVGVCWKDVEPASVERYLHFSPVERVMIPSCR